jgi:hypothetical protein
MSKIRLDAGSAGAMNTYGAADLAHPHEQDPGNEQAPVTLSGDEQTVALAMEAQWRERLVIRSRLLMR